MTHPDVVVVTFPHRLRKHEYDRIKESIRQVFNNGQKILILDGGMTLSVLPNTPMLPPTRSSNEQEERSTTEGNRTTNTD